MISKIDESCLYDTIQKTLSVIPSSNELVLDQLTWGCCETLFTPAYWKLQYHLDSAEEDFSINYRLSDCIFEEVIGFMLGLYEIQCEFRVEIFDRISNLGVGRWCKGGEIFEIILSIFPHFSSKKMQYLSDFIFNINVLNLPVENDLELRSQLLQINGIGWKNASWITRNFLDSENIIVLDSGVVKACCRTGIFKESRIWKNNYLKMEQIFIEFCRILDVVPSKMCLIMKDHVRTFN